jgi:hypothetical protein
MSMTCAKIEKINNEIKRNEVEDLTGLTHLDQHKLYTLSRVATSLLRGNIY